MEMSLKNKSGKQIRPLLKYVEAFIKELLNAGDKHGELYYMVDTISKNYIIIRAFILMNFEHNTAINPEYNIRTTRYNSFKGFLYKIHDLCIQKKLSTSRYRLTGLELRLKPDRLQICDALIYSIPKKGIKRINNGINLYVDSKKGESENTPEWIYGKPTKSAEVLKAETFPQYNTRLMVTVNKRGVWYFKRNAVKKGRIIGVRNIKNFYTFSTLIHIEFTQLLIWAKLCDATYNLYNNKRPTPNIDNILKFLKSLSEISTDNIDFETAPKKILMRIPFIDTNEDKIIARLLKISFSNRHVTKRLKQIIAILVKMLLVTPEKTVIKYMLYLINLHNMLRLKDIPLFNERLITLHTELLKERKYYKKGAKESDIKKSMYRITTYIMNVVVGAHRIESFMKNDYRPLVDDTLKMALRLKYQLIYPNLATDKLKSYHNKLTKDTRLLDIGDVIPNIVLYKDVITVLNKSKDYTTTLINSGELLAEESAVQRHCVHNYASNITQGSCIIFSVHFREKRWTLEVKKRFHDFIGKNRTEEAYYIGQFKGFSNETAPDELYSLVNKSLKTISSL